MKFLKIAGGVLQKLAGHDSPTTHTWFAHYPPWMRRCYKHYGQPTIWELLDWKEAEETGQLYKAGLR